MSTARIESLLQFSHSSNNPRDDIATEAYEDELDMGRSGSYLNSSINSAWSEHSLDPEDIRVIPAFLLFCFRLGHSHIIHVWAGVHVVFFVLQNLCDYVRTEGITCRVYPVLKHRITV